MSSGTVATVEELRAWIEARQAGRPVRSKVAEPTARTLDSPADSPAPAPSPARPTVPAAREREPERAPVPERARFASLPGVAGLFPAGGPRRGASYVVEGSASLALAVLAAPSRDGAWCGVVGIPEFGVEAAAELGADPDRLVLVPDPGAEWLTVLGTLIDALDVVVVRPGQPARDADLRRLAARQRDRGTTLLVVDAPWPGAELRLTAVEQRWSGLGHGHGHLAARALTVETAGRAVGGRTRRAELWLPDRDGMVRAYAEADSAEGPEAAGSAYRQVS